MQRRSFLTALGAAPVMAGIQRPSSSGLPPRKVIVGTVMESYWVPHPGLKRRLTQLAANVESMHEESHRRYNREPDLAILPEVAVTGDSGPDVAGIAVPLDGELRETFAAIARKHNCYLVAPTYLRETPPQKGYSNAAVLFGRRGEVIGSYRKVHLVVSDDGRSFEAGCSPGQDVPLRLRFR